MGESTLLRTIETPTHGRYLVRLPTTEGPWPMVVGFHGYKEPAQAHLDALSGIPGIERWLVVSVQALHRFYTKRDLVVASWMTREDRDLAIADNIAYVGRVLDAVRRDHTTRAPLVFSGMSQGGAMAYRAAARYRADGVLILAADVPPDVRAAPWPNTPRVLIGRGTQDDWYTADKHAGDVAALQAIGVAAETCAFDAGHEWTQVFGDAAGKLLAELAGR